MSNTNSIKEKLQSYMILKDEYAELEDNDPNSAYSIMKKASALLEYFETEEAETDKELNIKKTNAESLESQVALKESPNNVSKGEKLASCNNEVMYEWNEYYTAKCTHGRLIAIIKFLWRVYYDSQNVWKNSSQIQRRDNN